MENNSVHDGDKCTVNLRVYFGRYTNRRRLDSRPLNKNIFFKFLKWLVSFGVKLSANLVIHVFRYPQLRRILEDNGSDQRIKHKHMTKKLECNGLALETRHNTLHALNWSEDSRLDPQKPTTQPPAAPRPSRLMKRPPRVPTPKETLTRRKTRAKRAHGRGGSPKLARSRNDNKRTSRGRGGSERSCPDVKCRTETGNEWSQRSEREGEPVMPDRTVLRYV